jgi:hypothetical protein
VNHIATITKSSKFPSREFHGQCSCGTAGDFATKDEAAGFLSSHGSKKVAESAVATFELVDNSDKPEVKPVLPSTHVAGVGSMPASHAKSPVPPPPPPPPPSAAVKHEAPKEDPKK